MSTTFDPNGTMIVVPCSFGGPSGSFQLTMAVDTGATRTVINPYRLIVAGYDPTTWGSVEQIITANGAVFAPQVTIGYVRAFGWQRNNVAILAHHLPPSLHIDGLLGLDFFRDHVLTIDFHQGEIEMTAGPSASATP
jgi:hypothetical protein